MILYHSTSPESAARILADGFRDGDPVPYPDGGLRQGVFVSDTSAPRRATDVVLKIEWSGAPSELEQYAYNVRVWPPYGNDYREWLVPALRLKACDVRR